MVLLTKVRNWQKEAFTQVIFGGGSFWIGLTDVEKEGEWQWNSGEPVTYTNWATQQIYRDRLSDVEKDYVVFTFKGGEWQSVSPGSRFWQITEQVVIEKDGLVSDIDR